MDYFKCHYSRPSLRRIPEISFQEMLSAMSYTILVLLEEILFICRKNHYPHRQDEEN